MTRETPRISRRQALQMLGGAGAAGLAGCTSAAERLPSVGGESGGDVTPREPPAGAPDTTVELTASPGTVTAAPNAAATQWLYDGEFPAREIRASEGDLVSVTLRNRLSAETTIHWHGLPVANPMDGVPGVTQRPVGRGETFEYRFRAEPAGTYFFHSHAGLQLDRGLLGPLVVEEQTPHVEFDREYVVVLDDYLPSEPRPASERGGDAGGVTGGGPTGGGPMGGGPMGGMMNLYRPPYEGHLVNGRLAGDPPAFDVSEGERVRFRFVNASSATMYQVGLGGHQFDISHADGRPVEPVTVDSFSFGPGERYDAIVTADNPGAWGLVAAAVSGPEPPALGRLQYDGTGGQSPKLPNGDGRHLRYSDLRAVEPLDGLDGSPDKTFDLTLAPGGDGYAWTIGGQTYPEADPLRVNPGDHVRVNMVNRSPVRHPMHLHGHFFQVGDAVKDTVVVPGHMGQVRFEFRADNPGDWLFHCHNLYHLEAGMARLLTYG